MAVSCASNVYKLGVLRGGKTVYVAAKDSKMARRFLGQRNPNWMDSEKTYCRKVGSTVIAQTPAIVEI